jgi:uroporphyrinogen decarboxylase
MELFHDGEIAEAIVRKFDLLPRVRPDDPYYNQKRLIAVNRFVGFDYVVAGLVGLDFPLKSARADDTAALKHTGGRYFAEEHAGPITNWEEFECYPWPDPTQADAARDLEWFSENLPDDLCLVGGLGAHFAELLTWMMGYETLCFALFDQRDLVAAIAARLRDFFRVWLRRVLEFDRVKMVWGSDDMGFKTGLMLSPADMREFVLAGHREQAARSHAAGRPYLLHACGNLSAIMDDLVTDVKIDAKHSFEDTIEDVREAKKTYGRRIALLGGVDVDFLCRSDEQAVRRRVRETLQACLPGGGYCLGTGNSVANYIPLDHYLAMVDEGRLYGV